MILRNLMGNPWAILGIVAVLTASHAAVGWRAWSAAMDRAEARNEAANAALRNRLARNAEEQSRSEAAFLELEAERAALARQLEDEARADPDAGRVVLPVGSVRRIFEN